MRHIGLLREKFDVEGLYGQLNEHPEFWNTLPYRTNVEGSPHREVDDIWVRYNALENLRDRLTSDFNAEHTSVWYPVAEVLTHAKVLALDLKNRLDADRLGGVLITRVRAGCQVYPHSDAGWHARYYDKFVIQIRSAPGQCFAFEDGALDARTGESYWFDNAYSHWVTNPTNQDRISLIVCLRGGRACH